MRFVPTEVTIDATSPEGAIAWWDVRATDNIDSAPAVGCLPTSGTMFPIGDTPVTRTATDAAGNSTTAEPAHAESSSSRLADPGSA